MEIYLPIADLPVNVFLIFFMGVAVGFVSGMFSIGAEGQLLIGALSATALWTVAGSLPPAAVGDYLIIERAGAYGFVMASYYNSKPSAAEVLIRSGHPQLIRSRQTLDDLIRGEVIPREGEAPARL